MKIHFALIPFFSLLLIATINSSHAQPSMALNHTDWPSSTPYTALWAVSLTETPIKNPSDSMFIKKASEANLAEIELAQLALQKASSEKVKEFAQTMIEHHTMAQTALASIVINHPTWAPNRVTDAQHNDAHKTATLGGTGGTVGNATAEGMTNGRYNSNLPARDTTLQSNSKAATRQGMDDMNEINKEDTLANMPETTFEVNASDKINNISYALPTEPSPGHKALKKRLATLSGAQFDRQYMLAMVEEHKTTVLLFEKKAMDKNSNEEQLISYAKKHLPLLKKHYALAKEISKYREE